MNRSHEGCSEEWEGGDVVELGCAWTTILEVLAPQGIGVQVPSSAPN